jgi:hypothetical protein
VILPNVVTDGVTRVTEGCLEGFWHFWHLITLAIQKVALLGRRAKRRVIQQREILVKCPQAPGGDDRQGRKEADEHYALLLCEGNPKSLVQWVP